MRCSKCLQLHRNLEKNQFFLGRIQMFQMFQMFATSLKSGNQFFSGRIQLHLYLCAAKFLKIDFEKYRWEMKLRNMVEKYSWDLHLRNTPGNQFSSGRIGLHLHQAAANFWLESPQYADNRKRIRKCFAKISKLNKIGRFSHNI